MSNFLLAKFEDALANFNDALLVLLLLGNTNNSIFGGIFVLTMNNSVLNSNCILAKYCSIAD